MTLTQSQFVGWKTRQAVAIYTAHLQNSNVLWSLHIDSSAFALGKGPVCIMLNRGGENDLWRQSLEFSEGILNFSVQKLQGPCSVFIGYLYWIKIILHLISLNCFAEFDAFESYLPWRSLTFLLKSYRAKHFLPLCPCCVCPCVKRPVSV